jgi:hypothetical protein
MAINYMTYGNGAYTSNTVPVTLQNQTNFINGKTIMVAYIFCRGGSASPVITKPSAAWTQIGSTINVGAYMSGGCYWAPWATGGTAYTWSVTNTTYGNGQILAFNGCDYVTPINNSNSGSGASGTTLTVTSINATRTGSGIAGFCCCYNSTTRTWTSESCATAGALSEKVDSGSRTGMSSSALIWTSSGATGNFTATMGSNSGWIGWLVTLYSLSRVFVTHS